MSAVCCPVVLLLVWLSCRWQRLCVVLPRVSFLRLLGASAPVWANVTKSPRLPIPMLLSMGSSGSSQASVRVPQRTPGDASNGRD